MQTANNWQHARQGDQGVQDIQNAQGVQALPSTQDQAALLFCSVGF